MHFFFVLSKMLLWWSNLQNRVYSHVEREINDCMTLLLTDICYIILNYDF